MADFDIGDVADLLGIRRLGQGDNFDVVCPYCGDTRGKMNFCIRKNGREVNLYHCFHCGAGGNMLTLYADMKGITGTDRWKRACREIGEKLKDKNQGNSRPIYFPDREKEKRIRKQEIPRANGNIIDRVYRQLFSQMTLTGEHERKLADRGLSGHQIEALHARSIPAGEGERLAEMLLNRDLRVAGVPGFFRTDQGNWSIAFPKSDGILFPIPDEKGRWCAVQMRMDHEKDGRKYLWLSSAKYPAGVSSKSPAAFWGDMDSPKIAVTEGGLKAYCAWCFSGKPFIGLPGVGQAGSLRDFLTQKRGSGQIFLECMDMDKYMDVSCDGKDRHCKTCDEKDGSRKTCPHKLLKRTLIREGCNRFYRLCEENGLSCRRLKWDIETGGRWDGRWKGIDDKLLSLKKAG